MSITKYKDSGGRIRYRVQECVGTKWNGKPDRPSKVCDTLKEAHKAQAQFDATKMRNQGKAYGMNCKEFVETVFLPAKTSIVTYDTLRAYKRDINLRIIPAFGHLDINDIDCLRIQKAISLCPTKKTAQNMRNTLRTILNMAVQLKVIPSNPAMGEYSYPKAIKKREDEKDKGWLTNFKQHKEVLVAAQGESMEAVILLGLCSGLRKGEILGLDWEDVDFDAHTLTVRQTFVLTDAGFKLQPPKTEKSCRTIPLTDYEEKRLKILKRNNKLKPIKGGTPVVNYLGGRMKSRRANKLVDSFFKSNPKLPRLTIQNMRHSFATASIRAGVEVSIVSRWLGHTNVTTTYNRYVKPILKDLQEDVTLINQAFGKVKKAS